MAEPVVLALQQMMQRQNLRRPVRPRPVGVQPARDDVGAAVDAFQLRLEGGRLLAVGMPQSLVARRQCENALSRGAVVGAGFLHNVAQDLAVALGRDRQPVLEIPGGEAAFGRVVAQLDLAALPAPARRTSR